MRQGESECVMFLVIRISTEERKLVERFGTAHLNYSDMTGQFLPCLRRAQESD